MKTAETNPVVPHEPLPGKVGEFLDAADPMDHLVLTDTVEPSATDTAESQTSKKSVLPEEGDLEGWQAFHTSYREKAKNMLASHQARPMVDALIEHAAWKIKNIEEDQKLKTKKETK